MTDPHFRRSARGAIDLRLGFRLADTGSELEKSGRVLDLGIGGIRVACARPPAVGASLVLALSLPSAWEPLELPAEVRWAKAGEFGAEFGAIAASSEAALRTLISRLAFEETA